MTVVHKAQALAITCIDFRFQEMVDEDIKKRHVNGHSDVIAWPGASKDFEKVFETAKLSLKLHDPNQVYIYEHEDCGAYGENNSQETHKQNAERLASSLKEFKPTLEITNLIATPNGIKPL